MLHLLCCLSTSSQTACRNSSLLAVSATLMTFIFMQFLFSSYVNLSRMSSSKSNSVIVTAMIQIQNPHRNEKAPWNSQQQHWVKSQTLFRIMKCCFSNGYCECWSKTRCCRQLATELLSSSYIYAIHKCDRNSLLLCFLAFHHVPLYVTDTTAILDGWLVVAVILCFRHDLNHWHYALFAETVNAVTEQRFFF